MFKGKIYLSIVAAIILIAASLLSRHKDSSQYKLEVVQSDKTFNPSSYEAFGLDQIIKSDEPAEPLSNTDLISRQLFSDYISLEESGGKSQANFESLAYKYADNILEQPIVSGNQVTTSEYNAIPNTQENIRNYGQKVLGIRNKYSELISKTVNQEKSLSDEASLIAFSNIAAELYTKAANEVKAVKSVPTSLLQNHVNLVNNYFQSAETIKKISSLEDPILIFTALQTQEKNSATEEALILNIQQSMASSNGII